jgi:hypothetical protein
MLTPAGTECPFYYADFFRGRNKQTCRLIERTPRGGTWSPDLCSNCRVPRILLANACPNLILQARVRSGLLGLKKRVEISAFCSQTLEEVDEPEIGCGRCHQAFTEFHVSGENK